MGSSNSSEETDSEANEDDHNETTSQTVDSQQSCRLQSENDLARQADYQAPNDVTQQHESTTSATADQHVSETSGSLIYKPTSGSTSGLTSGSVTNPSMNRRALAWEIDVSDLGARRQTNSVGSQLDQVNLNSYLEEQTFEPVEMTVEHLMQRKVLDQRRWSVTWKRNGQTH